MVGGAAVVLALLASRDAGAHCDTMDGPVVAAARIALEKRDATPVLKWVKADKEDEIKAALAKALVARKASPEAREVADTWFFESLVRIHRAGEGEPFTGILPSGTPLDSGVGEADLALQTGDVDELAESLAAAVADGVKRRFARAIEAKKSAEQSVEAGREYVEAYVEFLHYVERLHADIAGGAHGHGPDHEGR